MPSIANVTVKKADGTTDIVYDALTGAAGDGSPAVWRQDTGANAALPVGFRALVQMSSVNNGPKTARRLVVTFKRPYAVLNSTTGRYESYDENFGRFEFTGPNAIPASENSEAAHQLTNLLASAHFKACLVALFAAS